VGALSDKFVENLKFQKEQSGPRPNEMETKCLKLNVNFLGASKGGEMVIAIDFSSQMNGGEFSMAVSFYCQSWIK